MIDLALDTEEQVKRMTGPMGNPQQMPQAAPIKKGMGEQFGDMAKQKAMEGVLTAGTEGLTAAGTSALSGSAMAGIGTAVPYVGAGLMAGKMLGLFNQGGQVGPLSAEYAASGYPGADTLKSYIGRNPESIGALKTEYDVRNKAQQEDLAKQKRLMAKSYEDLTPFKTINNILQEFGNPYSSESERQAAYNRGFAKNYGSLFNQYRDAEGYDQGGEVMTEEQAMALMNNQPEPMAIPMPQSRPINFPDPEELLQEMSMPQSRPQLQDPYGADRTFSPYDMLRPDNAPNT